MSSLAPAGRPYGHGRKARPSIIGRSTCGRFRLSTLWTQFERGVPSVEAAQQLKNRGPAGWEAWDAADRSLGLFETAALANAAIVAEVQALNRTKPNQDEALAVEDASDLEMIGVEWLWSGRFARGKFGLIAGLPDMGKGQIAAFLAAAVTAGVELPCGEGHMPQGNVIWLNAEDGLKDTVKPRLVAAGADLKRVRFINAARVKGQERTFKLVTDLPLLRRAIEKKGNVALVIIDPISAYLGIGKVDGRSATDIRSVLTPLKEMAEELNVAVIAIAHFNKKDDVKSALLRVSDSLAYVAAARHVYAVVDDPEDKNAKLFVKAKNNLAKDATALRYGFGVETVDHDPKLDIDIKAPYIVWHPQHVEITANEAMQGTEGKTRKREAREFLLDRLRAGPAKSADLLDEAKQEGIAERTLKHAKKELGVGSYPVAARSCHRGRTRGSGHGSWACCASSFDI